MWVVYISFRIRCYALNCCHCKSYNTLHAISSHSLSSSQRQILDPELQCDLWPDDQQLPTSPTEITPEPTTNNYTVSLSSSPSLQATKTPDDSPTSLQSMATSSSASILLIIILFYSLTHI